VGSKSCGGEAGAETTAEDAGEGESSRRRGRGRGRARTKQGKAQRSSDEPTADEEQGQTENRAAEDEGKDEELDNLSDWNVPSWTELIASLYRPER
jgi:hypothetical protein